MADAPDTWSDNINDEPEYVQRMVRWFFEHYEAAESESVPFYAEDVIEDQFCEEYEPEEISRAIDFIGEWGDEWSVIVKDPNDELEDDSIEEEQKETDDE